MDFLKLLRSQSKLSDQETVDRATHANKLLSDPVLKSAFEEIRGELLKDSVQSNHSDTEKRENNYFMLKALDGVEAALHSFVDKGKWIKKD